MKKFKKPLIILLLLFLISTSTTFLFTACRDKTDDSSDVSSGTTYITQAEAISTVKNSKYVKDKIATYLGFQSYNITWGTSSASASYDNGWRVKISGSMMGYTDDYRTKFDSKKFNVEVQVTSTGSIGTTYVSWVP